MKYINILNNILIIIIKKKTNENIALGEEENYKEFGIVYNNSKSEFVRIKTVDADGNSDYSNLKQIIKIMRTIAFEGFDGK